MNFEHKVLSFLSALSYTYATEERREDLMVPSLELTEDDLTEDFTAMIWAMYMFYRKMCDDNCDILDFLNVMTRLIFQHSHALENESTSTDAAG